MKFLLILLSILVSGLAGYSQDSLNTKNDKPGTPGSLLKSDNTPQTHVQIDNKTTSNQSNINRPSESNNTNNTTQHTTTVDPNTPAKRDVVNPNTLNKVPPAKMRTTTNSSAIQNGISNSSKPLRH